MEKYTISKRKFLAWYFEYGQDSENEEIKSGLTSTVIAMLFEKGFAAVSSSDLFENCNKGAIRICFTEEHLDEDSEEEIGDLGEFELTLIE